MYALNGRLVSLLHLAAHHGWMDIVINLITKYKYEINYKYYSERTSLHYAAINNQLEVVRYLINEQNGDPMIKENFNGVLPYLSHMMSPQHHSVTSLCTMQPT